MPLSFKVLTGTSVHIRLPQKSLAPAFLSRKPPYTRQARLDIARETGMHSLVQLKATAGAHKCLARLGVQLGALLLLPQLVGCGAGAVPNSQLTTAESAVRAAEVGGAEELPKGELHLKYARDAIAEARTLMDKGDNKEAALRLDKTTVDAEQALALAEEEEARLAAQEQLDQIKELMKQ